MSDFINFKYYNKKIGLVNTSLELEDAEFSIYSEDPEEPNGCLISTAKLFKAIVEIPNNTPTLLLGVLGANESEQFMMIYRLGTLINNEYDDFCMLACDIRWQDILKDYIVGDRLVFEEEIILTDELEEKIASDKINNVIDYYYSLDDDARRLIDEYSNVKAELKAQTLFNKKTPNTYLN